MPREVGLPARHKHFFFTWRPGFWALLSGAFALCETNYFTACTEVRAQRALTNANDRLQSHIKEDAQLFHTHSEPRAHPLLICFLKAKDTA